MDGIQVKNNRILYYGNTAGYLDAKRNTAVVDPMFRTDEMESYLSEQKGLSVEWASGTYDRLTSGISDTEGNPQVLKKCRIHQLKPDADVMMKFIGYDELTERFGEPDPENYEVVYDGEVSTNDLEALYEKFNIDHPPGYKGHSLSISDVVELYDVSGSTFHYVDRFGFKEIDFQQPGQEKSCGCWSAVPPIRISCTKPVGGVSTPSLPIVTRITLSSRTGFCGNFTRRRDSLMIERLWIKRASAMWSIDGVRLTMGHRTDISDDEMTAAIEKYRNLLKRQSFQKGNAGLCDSFRFFGGISFVKLGSMAFTKDFTEMFRYYAKAAVIRWAESEYTIRSKELGAHFVFEEMLRCENDPIHYDYTYIFDEVPGSHRYQEILESEFSAFWSERVKKQMLEGLDLKDVTRKIGLLRCAEYAALTDRQTMETYLHGIAHTFTDRREQISLSKLFGNVYGGTRTSSKLIPCSFDQMMRWVTNEEFRLQYEKFPAENHLQLDVHSDQWVLYAQHGPTLRFNKMDFTVIRSAPLRMEVKYYLKQRFSGFIQIKDRFLTAVAYGVNFLSSHNRRIHFFSDISECDAKALHIALENRNDEPGEKQWAFSNTMSIFSAMQTVTDYLMGGLRDENIKSPVPQSNPFRAFVFHNSKDYIKNTLIIPESVMNEMDRHMYELCGEYRLLYRILSQTGIRTKEAVFLEDDCLEKTGYDGIFNLRYIPYKVLAARRRRGREDHRRIMITGELAAEIVAQTKKTEKLREEYGLPYIFIAKRKNFKASMINPEHFLVKLDQIAKRYDLRDENGALWHFTARQYRKTLAVTLIENGGTMEELAYLLGHLSPSTSAAYYADVRKKKLAEMNTAFFKAKFELMLSDKQLSRFSEEERRALYVDFCLESRRVEFGHCLKKLSEGGCTSRNSLLNCVNCKNLCTGVKYLPYWRQLHTEQAERLNALLSVYHANAISGYEKFPEYKQEKALAAGYAGIVRALEGGEV